MTVRWWAPPELEQSGWMLAGWWPRDICVCYHLSSSINDNKRLRYRGLHITMILRITWLVINYKSDPQIIMILKLLHFVSISVICGKFFAILTHFIGAFPRQFKRVASYLSSSCIIMSPHWPPSDWSRVTTQSSDWLMLVTWVWCQPTWSWSVPGPIHFISHNICSRHTQKLQGDIKILEFIVNSHHHILH